MLTRLTKRSGRHQHPIRFIQLNHDRLRQNGTTEPYVRRPFDDMNPVRNNARM